MGEEPSGEGTLEPPRVCVRYLVKRVNSHPNASFPERACGMLRWADGWRPRKTRPAVSACETRVSR